MENKFEYFIKELMVQYKAKSAHLHELEFEGCSQTEIDSLNALVAPDTLPETYVTFLRYMGKNKSVVSGGIETYYSMTFERQVSMSEALKEDGCEDFLSGHRFNVGSHDGFINFIISLNAGDNPPVYEHVEGRKPQKWEDSFTDFLIRESGLWSKREILMKTLPVLD